MTAWQIALQQLSVNVLPTRLKTCGNPACKKKFRANENANRYTKEYCSDACQRSASSQRKRERRAAAAKFVPDAVRRTAGDRGVHVSQV